MKPTQQPILPWNNEGRMTVKTVGRYSRQVAVAGKEGGTLAVIVLLWLVHYSLDD